MSKAADNKKPSSEASAKAVTVALESASALPGTGEPEIRIDSDVTRRIRQHARAHLKTEVCGVLIGESNDHTIEIHASIEALNAAQAGTHVTFTQDAWEEIYKVKDDLYPDARIVGWYHSHPGFGIFLSEHDLFIQENFFSSPGQVAWVYDPHSDDEGCFGWVEGKVARLTTISTLYQSGDPVEHATKGQDSDLPPEDEGDDDGSPSRSSRSSRAPLWVIISRTILTHLTVLLAGFAIAFFFFPRLLAVIPNPLTGQVDVIDYHDLRPYLDKNAAILRALQSQDHPSSSNSASQSASPAPSGPPAPSNQPAAATNPAPGAKPAPAATPGPQPDKQGSHQ